MRCLSLEQRWRADGGISVFVSCIITKNIKSRLQLEHIEMIQLSAKIGSIDDAQQTAELAKKLSASWVVLDGYHFDATYQKVIKDSGFNLLVVDDYVSASHYYADIVLNQNLHACNGLYLNREPYTRLLLGASYVVLRDEFLTWRGWKREIAKTAQNILVTLGGSDAENVTLKVIKGIQETGLDNLAVIVVASNNQHYEQLVSVIKNSGLNIQLKTNVSRMAELMTWADIAISAGGTSTWELAFMGLPMLMIAIADNQCQIVEELGDAGIAVNLGWYQNVTSSTIATSVLKLVEDFDGRARMSKSVQALVDGRGADRVLTEIRKLCG